MMLVLERPGAATAAAELVFVTIYVLTILLVPARAVNIRLLSLALLAAVSWVLGNAFIALLPVPQWRATMTTFCGIQLLNASEILCVFCVDSPSLCQPAPGQAKTSSSDYKNGTATLVSKAIALLWNLRRIGTQWEIKRIAPTRRESPVRFLLRRVSLTLLAYSVLEVLLLQPPPERALIAPGKETLFHFGQLSMNDIYFRVGATIGMGITVALYNLIMVNIANIVLVAVGMTRPEDCPTLNGAVGEAYSVRKFWGSVWQQGLQRPLAGHANAVVNSFLPRGSPISRVLRLLLAFFISGLLHLLTDIGLGVPSQESGAVLFFTLQPLGIIIEEAARALDPGLTTSVRRIIGYLWVLAFMSWSVPTWSYKHLRLGMDPADMLPFPFLSPMIDALARSK